MHTINKARPRQCFNFLNKLTKGSNIAVHTKHTIRHNQSTSAALRFLEYALQIFQIQVLIPVALRFTQANSVDNGRVVQRVRDDGVFLDGDIYVR